MSADVILLVGALFFTAVALFGGGFSAKEITVPRVPATGRLAAAALAVLLFAGSAYLINTQQGTLILPGQPTSAGSATTPPTVAASPTPSPTPATPITTPASTSPPPTPTSPAESPTPPTPEPEPEPEPLASDQETLLDMLPDSVADFCARSTFGLRELGTRASLECHLPSGVQVDFHWFATADGMDEVFGDDVAGADVGADGDCAADQWSYVGTWSVDNGRSVGRLLCFLRSGEARVVWTYNQVNLFAHAVRVDGDVPLLHRWWSDTSAAVSTL